MRVPSTAQQRQRCHCVCFHLTHPLSAWEGPTEVREIWGKVVDPLFPRDRPAQGLSQEQHRQQLPPSSPALQVLGGFSRHKAISCLKQLTNLHRNWRTLCVSGMDAAKSCSGRQPKFVEQSASKGGNWWCLLMEGEPWAQGPAPGLL